MSSGPSPALRARRGVWSALPLAERVQWSQGADNVEVWLLLPPGTAKHELSVEVTATRLRVNLGWAGRVLDGPLTRSVKASEAVWREVVRLHILLPKAERHYWRSLFEGGAQKSHLEVLQEALAADEPHQAYDQLDPEAQALVDDLRERQWLAANTAFYCNIPGGTTCQNCAGGNCTSADSRWLNPSLCQLPTSLGGTLNNVCSDPFLAPAFAPMLYRTSLTASVTDSQSGNETVAVVGSVTAMIVAGPSLVVTVQTSCPWMIWSSATNPATQTDSNALLAASYQTVYDGGTVDLVAPMKLQPSLAATPSYYTCMTFSVPLAVPAACPPFGQLYVRVTLNNVNRVFARQ
ncbi:CS domain-containing protein, partial [Haematococcus lacustris]